MAFSGELNGSIHRLRSQGQGTIPDGEDALLNLLKVKEGYEKAVSSALGQWIVMAVLVKPRTYTGVRQMHLWKHRQEQLLLQIL